MTVLMVERVSPSLRGELSRWMIEPRAGVFVGRLSAMVRDRLFELAGSRKRDGAVTLIHQSDCEQGFVIRSQGDTSRRIVDLEGLQLVTIPKQR